VPLGITETKASPAAPEIPPLADTPGFEKVDINVWFGLYGPKDLPESVTNTLRQALDSSLQSATLQEKMQSNGATLYAPGMNAAEFQAKEVDKYARLVELAKLQAE
jgi:tripartite-type tricarboxylate transporter receptor subunit TctC